MTSGFVTSDLHLFTDRVDEGVVEQDIYSAARESDLLVLNGDIFDFRWSRYGSIGATIEAASAWLYQLAAAAPFCRIVYILGNHDAIEPWAAELTVLSKKADNLIWNSSHYRAGSNLFLHGDLALAPAAHPLERPLTNELEASGEARRFAYRAAVAAGVPRAVVAVHHPRVCAPRIHRSLSRQAPEMLHGVTDVFFGHTHRPFSDHEHRGIRFHNTGSSVRGLRQRPLRFIVHE